MRVTPTDIPDVLILEPKVFGDERGFFTESFNQRAFDVAVDIREGSATFGRWIGIELSAVNHKQIWIPAGFAHGFLVISDAAEVQYKATDYYAPNAEACIRWDDPQLAIP